MGLILSTREEEQLLRFTVGGQWEYNDALTLAYQVKAAGQRTGLRRVLVDLRDLTASRSVQGRFLASDRLLRVLGRDYMVALVGSADVVDVQERSLPGAASVVLFASDRPAVSWLRGVQALGGAPIKNPSVLRSEGQIAGKET